MPETLVIFGDFHRDGWGNTYFECNGEYVPFKLERLSGLLSYGTADGKYYDASSLRIEKADGGGHIVVGGQGLFEAIYADYYRAKIRKQTGYEGKDALYGGLLKDAAGNYYFRYLGEDICLVLVRRDGKLLARLQSGELVDASGIRFENDEKKGTVHVIGDARLLSKMHADHLQSRDDRLHRGQARQVLFGEYEIEGGVSYLRVGEAWMRLNIVRSRGRARGLMLNNGKVLGMDGVDFRKDRRGRMCMWGPEGLLQEVLADFGEAARGEKSGTYVTPKGELVAAPPKTAEYSVVGKPERKIGTGGILKRAAMVAVFAASIFLVTLISPRLSSFIYSLGGGAGEGRAKTEQVAEQQARESGHAQEFQTAGRNIRQETPAQAGQQALGGPQAQISFSASKPAQPSSPGISIDLGIKENAAIARRMGFEGIARKINPHMSAYETATMARKLARDNLKPGHNNINKWNVNDLKTPRMVRVY